ncbi:MAG: RNA methyltransferase [Candidatus Paceibacterota bacterium]|jgi:tRNA G18 (ribose-2'-O)-methylase SpoU
MIVILHNIRSLYNVGSIFRTADAVGVEKIYLCGYTPSPKDKFGKYIPQLSKVALGAEKSVPWESARNTAVVIKKLKKDGYKIFAVEQSKKSVPYYKPKTKGLKLKNIALIVGNEVKGISPSILKLADKILEIPMAGSKESLNVSVAFGIVAFGLKYS